MIENLFLAFSCFGAVVIFIIIVNIILVKYYNHQTDSESLPTVTAIISLTLPILSLLLIPVDIYTVSIDDLRNNDDIHTTIQYVYAGLYCCILFFSAIVIPFSYFYYEEYDPDEKKSRCGHAFKFTAGFIVVVIALVIMGLFLQSPFDFSTNDPPDVWAKKLIGKGGFIGAVSFFVGCLTILGYVIMISYTAYGLSSLPFRMIKGTATLEEEKGDYEQAIKSEKKKLINDKKGSTNERDSRKIIAYKNRMRRLEEATSGCFKICFIFRPIAVIIGVFYFLLSFAICLSISWTLINRIINHLNCGPVCGFILKYQKISNPIDYSLVFLSKYFPADYVLICIIIFYLYLCTLNAITKIGIKICCYKLYPFRKARTPPQGILIGSIMLMLSILSLNNLLTNIAPTYSMFGTQTTIPPNTTEPVHCSIEYYNSTTSSCSMTQIGEIINIVSLKVPFMGLIFFAMICLFVIVWLLGIFVAGFSKKQSLIDEHSSDDEIVEDFE